MADSTTQTTQSNDGFNPFKPEYGFGAPSDSVDLIKLLRVSYRKLAVGLVLGLILGVVAYLFLGPAYLASTRMLVSLKAAISNEEIGTRTFSDRTGHVHLIKSDFIVERAFEIGDLGSLPTLAAAGDPIESIIDALKVQRSSGTDRDYTNVFEISFQSKSQDDAKAILEAVIAAYEEYLTSNRTENTDEMLNLVVGKEAELRGEIEALEAEYIAFREDAPLHFTAPVGQQATGLTTAPPNYYVSRLQEIEKDRRGAFIERAETQARIQALTKMRQSGESRESLEFFVMHAMTQPTSGQGGQQGGAGGGLSPTSRKESLDSELLAARTLEQRLLYNFGSDHERVSKVRQKIKLVLEDYILAGLTPPNLDVKLSQDGKTRSSDLTSIYLRSLSLKLVELEFREQELDKLYREARADAKNATLYEVKDKRFSDALERRKDQLQIVVNQSNTLDLTKEQTGYTTKQIAPIRVELATKRIIKILGALGVLGVGAVFAWQYLREWQNKELRHIDDIQRFVSGNVLGSVPAFPVPTAADMTASLRTGLAPQLRYVHDPSSPEAEAFRSIRTTLFHSSLGQHSGGTVIQVTSSEPGDGKSTVTGNLASAIAQSGKSVLLIDADLRRPTAHQIFGVRGDVGVTDVLRGDVNWQSVCQQTSVDGLAFLAAGSPTDMPAEMLSNSNFGTLLAAAREEFDYILIDTPPILAVSDPCIIGPFVDGLVLVVRLYKNTREQAQHATDALNAHGIPLVGIIANGGEASESCYYDYRPRQQDDTAASEFVSKTDEAQGLADAHL